MKYKVKFKVEKIYNVEVDIEDPPTSSDELSDSIYDLITDDYEVGNMRKDEADETFSVEEIKEVE